MRLFSPNHRRVPRLAATIGLCLMLAVPLNLSTAASTRSPTLHSFSPVAFICSSDSREASPGEDDTGGGPIPSKPGACIGDRLCAATGECASGFACASADLQGRTNRPTGVGEYLVHELIRVTGSILLVRRCRSSEAQGALSHPTMVTLHRRASSLCRREVPPKPHRAH